MQNIPNSNVQNSQNPPQYGQNPQYPSYGAGRPMPPKKKSVWPKVLMIGCGCLAGIAVVVGVFFLLMMRQCEEHSKDRTTPMIEELNVGESLVQKNHLDSLQIKEMIYIGMPKDSVLITLGKPDEYLDASWGDYVSYNINDSTSVRIDFYKELVDDIVFSEFVPENLQEEEVDSI